MIISIGHILFNLYEGIILILSGNVKYTGSSVGFYGQVEQGEIRMIKKDLKGIKFYRKIELHFS